MNEQIKKLAEQAGMSDDKFGMFFAKDKHNEDGVDLEKFAELLVAECLMKANGAKIRGESIDTLIQNITEDFGVK
jgi:hypothetical protein